MNKRAVELSINFVVIMILSIAILSSSLILVKQFFGKATQLKASLDSDTESKIRGLLSSGERVAVPLNTKEVTLGDKITFGVGISNILKDSLGPSNEFVIDVKDDTCESIGGGTGIDAKYIDKIVIDKFSSNIALILVDTKKGDHGKTYKCDITVLTDLDDGIAGNLMDYSDPVYKAYVKIK
jgi:hypothetical protein